MNDHLRLRINQIATDDLISRVEGQPLFVSTGDSVQVLLNAQALIDFDILAANGVFHLVDTIPTP